jgi:o-succinylbenzoate---CoA ligase
MCIGSPGGAVDHRIPDAAVTHGKGFAHVRRRLGTIGALIHRDQQWSYAELGARARTRAGELGSQGVIPGQVILVPDFPVMELAVMQHALADLDCGLFPVSAPSLEARKEELAAIAGAEWCWAPHPGNSDHLISMGQGTAVPSACDARAALVIETSGSSGAPKAVMLTRQNVLASASLVNGHLELRAGDVWLACLPRTHVGGLLIGYRCALAGATVLLHERFEARAVAYDLVRYGVTHISLVPAMLADLLSVAVTPPNSLRVVLVGGQALGTELARKAAEGGWPLYLTYGMTETCSQVATSRALSQPPAPGVVGPVLPGVEVACGSCVDEPRPLRIRGPVVMAGYANPERRPGEGLEDGWFRTSDLGCLTATGNLRVLGRADDLLVIGGESVLPSRVEEQIMSAPGVLSVVVVGRDDAVWGHRLVALYVGGVSPASLERWCREHLTGRDRPREFRRLEQLPVLTSGKPDRRGVRELIGAAAAGPQESSASAGEEQD